MAKKAYVKDIATKEGGFGNYDEYRGGGTPVGKGTKHPEGEGRGGYARAHSPGHRESGQPRTDDGKFTYNAVNGKPLKDVSKVDGHSRGVTIPPTLTGGKNGIEYYEKYEEDENGKKKRIKSHKQLVEDARITAASKTGLDVEQIFVKGQAITFQGKIAIQKMDFIETAQEFVANKDIDADSLLKADKKDRIGMGHFKGDPILENTSELRKAESDLEKKAMAGKKYKERTGDIVERAIDDKEDKELTVVESIAADTGASIEQVEKVNSISDGRLQNAMENKYKLLPKDGYITKKDLVDTIENYPKGLEYAKKKNKYLIYALDKMDKEPKDFTDRDFDKVILTMKMQMIRDINHAKRGE